MTSVSSIRALADHLGGVRLSTPPSVQPSSAGMVPLPRSYNSGGSGGHDGMSLQPSYVSAAPYDIGSSGVSHLTSSSAGSTVNVSDLIANSIRRQSSAAADGSGGAAGAKSTHHHHHHHSVVADVPQMQASHHHFAHDATGAAAVSSDPSARSTPPLSNLRELDIRTISKKVLGRLIIVGDVHGCPDQLRELARTLKYDPSIDLMIVAGDLVNKGPDSQGAVRAVMDLGAMAVVGNHDITVLELLEQIDARELNPFSRKASRDPAIKVARELTDDCIAFLRSLPHVIKIPQYNLIVLHAGMNLSYRLEDQSIRDLTHLRRLAFNEDRGVYDSIAKGNLGTLWAQLYEGPETVVFGHDARTGLQDEPFAIGLDTGCVYGGPLTAVVYPGRKFVSVAGLPRDKRLGAEEDFDEVAVRLDTPAREPSPAPSSFYDPVPLSSHSTPASTLVPEVDMFPVTPTVQDFFQRHKQLQQSATKQQPESSSMSTQRITDPILFLRSVGAAASSHEPSIGSGAPVAPAVVPSPPTSSPPLATAFSVQVSTLRTLVAGQHCAAFLALMRTDLYSSFWQQLLEQPGAGIHEADNSAPFWSSFVEMVVAASDREKTLTDDLLELVDILVEVLHEKREFLSPKALMRLTAFSARLECGDLKGLSKGVFKAVKIALQT